MRTKAQNQSRLMRIITIPLRMMGKARDLYVKSLTDCSMSSYAHAMAMPAGGPLYSSPLPRSFSYGSSRCSDSDDYCELIRAASVRRFGHSNEMDMYMEQMRRASGKSPKKVFPKSCSAGMGFMGRIDEDGPCESEGNGPERYARSRSYAVRIRGGGI